MKISVKDSSSVKVSYYGETSDKYDGHCLRAFSYFREELPLIRLAEPDEKCYKITLDSGEVLYVTEKDKIKYQNKECTVNDLLKETL